MKADKETVKEYVAIIIDAIDAVFNYLEGKTKAEFVSNQQLQDACLLRVIGWANMPPKYRRKCN